MRKIKLHRSFRGARNCLIGRGWALLEGGRELVSRASKNRQVAGLYKSIPRVRVSPTTTLVLRPRATRNINEFVQFTSLLDRCVKASLKKIKIKMQRGIIAWMTLATLAIVTVMAAVEAVPYQRPIYWDQLEEEDPEVIMEWLSRIGTFVRGRDPENTKRGIDLGLSRGFSGSQAAKHLMGLAAANYAGGPGRRRRSEQA